jgi:carbon monoxide dehydrogenase subunit G
MKSYEASATMAATPDAIWAILTDAPAYSDCNSGVLGLEGQGRARREAQGACGARDWIAPPVI